MRHWLFFVLAAWLGFQTLAVAAEPIAARVFHGKIEPSTSVTIVPRVSGELVKLFVRDGDIVKQGQKLAEIDPRPFQIKLDAAQAQQAVAEVRLKSAEGSAARAREMFTKGVTTREEADKADAAFAEARAMLLSERAAMQLAQLNLAFTQITSPIDGRLGQFKVDVGNFVTANEANATKLVTIVRTDPVFAAFMVDEFTMLELRKANIDVKRGVPVAIGIGKDNSFTFSGVIDFVDNNIETDGTLRIRAAVANPKDELMPGQFIRVRFGKSE